MRAQRTLAVLMVVVLAAVAAGCKVTAEDIETWKGTVKGPGKIVAVLKAAKYPIDLRVKAALALVEMDRSDVNGLNELSGALASGRIDPVTRQGIVDGMTPGLVDIMRGHGQAPQQAAPGADAPPPSPGQIRAKDAAFLVITYATPATRQTLTVAIIGWYVEDFNGRALVGNYSAEQIVRSLGAPAAAVLVDAMNAHMPREALTKIAELIGQLADAGGKARAAQRLVEIEQEMEGVPFAAWIEARVRAQLGARATDANAIHAVVEHNREGFINDGVLPAMKFLASQPVVSARLLAIAQTPSNGDADPLTDRRKRALMALEGNATQAQLTALLDIALDAHSPTTVRDYAFDRVGDLHNRDALPRLWPIVTERTDQRLRWRVGEMVLAIGGTASVPEFFSKLPTADDAKYAPEELAGYATRMGQMSPLPTDVVRPRLQSPNWWERVIALRYFERKGTAADIPAMQALAADPALCKGPEHSWDDGYTVGKVAQAAIEALRARLAQPSAPGATPPAAGH